MPVYPPILTLPQPRLARRLTLAALALAWASPARAEPETTAPACYPTAGGALEICRSGSEPEGVLYAPPPCRFGYGVQIVRLKARSAPGPLQVVFHAEPLREGGKRREDEACAADLRATDPNAGGSVRSGRLAEQLAGTMPPTAYRFWGTSAREETRQPRPRRRGRRSREAKPEAARPVQAVREGSGARDPMTVAGRDWAGDDYQYVFMIATEAVEENLRHVLIQARTLDFENFDVKSRREGSEAAEWVPFGEQETAPRGRRARRARRPEPAALAPVMDEAGKPIVGNCAGRGFDVQGLVGSISVVEQTYHYFYTDVLPADCAEPTSKRRLGLYLRTSRDVGAERAWSAPRTVIETLPPDTLVRVGKAKGMERWVLAYSCFRPANAAGGPVADICLHYTADLSLGAFKDLPLFAEPASAARSPAHLGLRSGGDGGGRYGRDGFFWMTDRYGNVDTPAAYPTKGGFLTWLDRLAPRSDGSAGSSLYGRPVYWSTWTVRSR
ncbi:hypothetical protein [Methylobacterium haplocladii]|uniref:DUF4185 domain-containing protein n=1 Tax=Methylobacterium haplocladii TaxID=1176176 RepID=A0A512IL57_9HYPH|nr:hypothetical protein [Methylobacterium haplocladii]GEO98382.1 hypothetical protein MHA02_07700 [Methylobacterium haplocladii]GJD83010.1 hypothetical protein HPGCJGGD_0872 [Methylobacterium haplocladii]